MRCVWDSEDRGVLGGEVKESIGRHHPIAITTVLTTLDRLREKGILSREKESKAYRYWAAVTEDELQQRIVGGMLDRLISQFPRAVAAYFAQQSAPSAAPGQRDLSDLARRIEQLESAEE